MRAGIWAAVLLAAMMTACGESPGGLEPLRVRRVEVAPGGRVLTVGDTMRLTAKPITERGEVLGGLPVTWISDGDDVATVRALGSVGVVEARAPGSVRISATVEGQTGSVVVTVVAAPLQVATVEIVPGALSLMPGQEHPAEAVLRTADGTVVGGRSITWTSSNAGVVTATSVGNPTFAMLRAHVAGTATIEAESGGVRGVAHVSVAALPERVHSITLTPADTTLAIGHHITLAPVLRSASGAILTGRVVEWSSTAPEVASVDQHGNVTARGAGVAAIRATSEGVTAQAAVRVTAAPATVAWVMVEPRTRSLWVDHIAEYASTTRVLAVNGVPLEGRSVTWSIADSSIAAVNAATGQVRGLRAGVTKVYGTAEGVRGEATLHVLPIPVGTQVYAVTHDWWDGQVRVAEPMGTVTWTDAAGVERIAELALWSGTLTIDHGVYPHTYERELVGVAFAAVGGVMQQVGERRLVDRGTAVLSVDASGTGYLSFVSTATPGLTFTGRARGHGEIVMRGDVGAGRIVDVLVRQRP